MLNLPQMAPVTHDLVPLNGGLDQVTSAYSLPPGALRASLNYACRALGGYYRIPGYERFSGMPSPSAASFVVINVTLNIGETITVGQSGTFGSVTGVVCYVDPALNFIGVTKTASTFSDPFVSGNITIGSVIGTATSYKTNLSSRDTGIFKKAASDIYRADILRVPGSGPILGVVYYKGVGYAFRNNAGGTAAEIYKSSVSGWQLVNLGKKVNFTAMATAEPTEGSTLTKGGVTATIDRWIITSGDVLAGTAAGYFVVSNVSGGSFSAGAATYPGGSTTLSGAETQITLLPNGKYNFNIGNFKAYSATERIYGADGVNDMFEFDGTVYVPIPVQSAFKPKNAIVHCNHLMAAVSSSLIHSALGKPYNFEVILGAGEIGTGGEITDLLLIPGNQGVASLLVLSNNATWILYGTSSADWKFVNYNSGIGGKARSAQNLYDIFFTDDSGTSTLKQSLNFGNFDSQRITHTIRPFIDTRRGENVNSSLNRKESQYRTFYEDGYGLYTTVFGGEVVGHSLVLYLHPVVCSFDGEGSNGVQVNLFGTADGFVMMNDVGTSFDGEKILAYINTNINAVKSARIRKRFRKAVIEVQSEAYVELNVSYSFDWATPFIQPHANIVQSGDFAGLSFWDSMIWDAFYWDGRTDDAISVELQGTGENLQMQVFCNLDFIEEFTLPSVVFHYTPRRANR